MNRVSFFAFTSYLQLLIVLFLLNVSISNTHASANGIKDRTSIGNNQAFDRNDFPAADMQFTRRGVWSRLFRNEINLPQKTDDHSHHAALMADIELKDGQIHLLPHDKRTIPIELRKALYAHGIVGRRR